MRNQYNCMRESQLDYYRSILNKKQYETGDEIAPQMNATDIKTITFSRLSPIVYYGYAARLHLITRDGKHNNFHPLPGSPKRTAWDDCYDYDIAASFDELARAKAYYSRRDGKHIHNCHRETRPTENHKPKSDI